jgi:DNA-binding NarL/FixJ family response regulator
MRDRPSVHVMIITDQPIMRDGLRLQVQREPDMQVVCEARDVAEALRELPICRPDVVVIDLPQPAEAGLRALRAIRALAPSIPVAVLTDLVNEVHVHTQTGQGVTVTVPKVVRGEEVIVALRAAITAVQRDTKK